MRGVTSSVSQLAIEKSISQPQVLFVRPVDIPKELVEMKRWVLWRLEPRPGASAEWTKVPYSAKTARRVSATSKSSWSKFEQAYMVYESDATSDPFSGIGFVLSGSGLVGMDLDRAVSESGEILNWAGDLMNQFPGAYFERSPSGQGIRGFFKGSLPPWGRKVKYREGIVELYDDRRFLTVTGHAVRAERELPNLQQELDAVHTYLFGEVTSVGGEPVRMELVGPLSYLTPEEQDIVKDMLTFEHHEVLSRLWTGDFADYDGDESRGEMRLANALAFYTRKDPLMMERIMRTGPYREKWDERRGNTTYLGMTIGNAIVSTKHVRGFTFNSPSNMICERENNVEHDATMGTNLECLTSRECDRLRADLDQVRQLRATDRRRARAESRLRALPSGCFTANEKSVIIEVARMLGAHLAYGNASLVIRRGAIVDRLGSDPTTVSRAFKVFDLPGSPVRVERVTVRAQRASGKWGPKTNITFHCTDVSCTADIIERMTVLGERLVHGQCSDRVGRRKSKVMETVRSASPVDDTKVMHSAPTDNEITPSEFRAA